MKKLVCCLSLITFLFLAAAASAVPPLQSKILIQYKADAIRYSDGDFVSSWGNSSGVSPSAGSYTLSQKTGYGLPTYVANAWHEFPAVRFVRQVDPLNESNDGKTFLQTGNWSWPTGTAAESITIFMVAQGGKSDINQRAVRVGRVGGQNGTIVDCDLRSGPGNTGVLGSGARFSNGAAAANNAFIENQWHISARRIGNAANINTFFHSIDGTTKSLQYTNPTNKVTLVDGTDNCIMMGNGTNNSGNFLNEWYDGDIAEVMVYKYLSEAEITTVYNYLYQKYNNLIAHGPSPAKTSLDQGEVDVEGGAPWRTKVTLTWNTAHDVADSTNVNPNVTSHYVYIAESEPNLNAMVYPSYIIPASGSTGTTGEIKVESGTRQYWRVDEVWDGTEPNQIEGDVWFFNPMAATPRIVTQPSSIRVFPGEEAYLEPVISSPTTASFQWYRTADNASDTPLDDTEIEAPIGTQQRLSFISAEIANEGYYYCAITNSASVPGSPTKTGIRMIGIKREMGHWTLDTADYQTDGVNGYYNDVADTDESNKHADGTVLNVKQHVMNSGVFAANSDYATLNQAVDFGTYPTAGGYSSNTVWAGKYTDWLTISAWVKWTDAITGLVQQGIISNQTSSEEGTSGNSWYLELKTSTNVPWLNCNGSAYDVDGNHQLTKGEWTHVVVTVGPDGTKFYYDGEIDKTVTTVTSLNNNAASRTDRPIYLGCSNRDVNGLRYPFNGIIDDVRIYNYQLSDYEVMQLYSDVTGEYFCVNPNEDDLTLDVAGGGVDGSESDCKVNMADLVEFIVDWLNCGIYPASGC